MTYIKTLLASAALAAVTLATPASAATIIKAFTGGPFSTLNPLGTLPATKLLKANTYDFTFTLVPPTGSGILTTVSAAASSTPMQGLPIQFSLYSGTPTGVHSLLDTSTFVINPSLSDSLSAGNYYLQIAPSGITTNGETGSGSLTVETVPEPATWGLLVGGFALVGSASRNRRRTIAA